MDGFSLHRVVSRLRFSLSLPGSRAARVFPPGTAVRCRVFTRPDLKARISWGKGPPLDQGRPAGIIHSMIRFPGTGRYRLPSLVDRIHNGAGRRHSVSQRAPGSFSSPCAGFMAGGEPIIIGSYTQEAKGGKAGKGRESPRPSPMRTGPDPGVRRARDRSRGCGGCPGGR